MRYILSLPDLKRELIKRPSACLPLTVIRVGKNWPHVPFSSYQFLFPSFSSSSDSSNSLTRPGESCGCRCILQISEEIQAMTQNALWENITSKLCWGITQGLWGKDLPQYNKNLSGLTEEWKTHPYIHAYVVSIYMYMLCIIKM